MSAFLGEREGSKQIHSNYIDRIAGNVNCRYLIFERSVLAVFAPDRRRVASVKLIDAGVGIAPIKCKFYELLE